MLAPMPQITVENLVKTYRIAARNSGIWGALRGVVRRQYRTVRALNGISFALDEGELIGYIGPNGAGKSTTVKVLAGILVPDSGECQILGRVAWRERIAHVARIGVVFGQRTQLWWDLPVVESFDLLRDIYRVPPTDYARRRDELVALLKLEPLLDVPVRQLSLGQRMRSDTAAALLHGPRLLFLDEPTIGLDPHQIRTVRQHIKELGKKHTVLISSHILPEVEVTCSRLLIFHEGTVVANDTPRGLEQSLGGHHRITVELQAPQEVLHEAWEEMAEIEHHRVLPAEGDFSRCALTPRDGEDLRPRVSALARARGWPLRELTRERHTLEDIFVHITREDDD